MPSIKLPDNSIRNFNNPLSINDIAKDIGSGLAKATVAGKIDGKLVDGSEIISNDCSVDRVVVDFRGSVILYALSERRLSIFIFPTPYV